MRADHTRLKKFPEPKTVDTKKLLEGSNTKYYWGSNTLTCSCLLSCICLWLLWETENLKTTKKPLFCGRHLQRGGARGKPQPGEPVRWSSWRRR